MKIGVSSLSARKHRIFNHITTACNSHTSAIIQNEKLRGTAAKRAESLWRNKTSQWEDQLWTISICCNQNTCSALRSSFLYHTNPVLAASRGSKCNLRSAKIFFHRLRIDCVCMKSNELNLTNEDDDRITVDAMIHMLQITAIILINYRVSSDLSNWSAAKLN